MLRRPTQRSVEVLALSKRISTIKAPRLRRQTAFADSPSSYFADDINPVLFSKLREKIVARHAPATKNFSEHDAQLFNDILQRVKFAVKHGDIDAVQRYWKELEERDFLPVLSSTALKEISSFIRHYVLSDNVHDVRFVSDLALRATFVGHPSLLVSWLLLHIQRNDPETVLQLYREFMNRTQRVEEDVQDEESDSVMSYIDPNQVRLLLCAITACAARDNFQHAVKLSLETHTRFHHYTKEEFLGKLSYDPALQAKVETYTQRLEVIKLVSRPRSLSKHVTKLSCSQAVNQLERLYHSIVQGIEGPDPYLAADPSLITRDIPISMTLVGWTSFLSAFFKVGRQELAETLWDDLIRLQVPIGTTLWNTVIEGRSETGTFLDAISAWEMMVSQGISPDALSYRALIHAFFRGHRPTEAMQRFKAFEIEVMPRSSLELQLTVFNTVLHGLLHSGRAAEANALLQRMTDHGPPPDVVSYNTFLAFFLQRLNLRGMASVVSKMTQANVQGDVVTFSTILSTLQRLGREDAADMIFNLMKKQNIEPNVVTYTAIIKRQVHSGNENDFRAAMQLLQKLEQNPKFEPTTITYTTILSGLYRYRFPTGERLAIIESIVERMRKRGVFLDNRTYTIIIKTTLALEGVEGLEAGVRYFREMVDSKTSVEQSTWYALLAGLLARKEWGYAKEVVEQLHASGIEPNDAVQDLIRRIHQQTQIRPRPRSGGYIG